VQHDGPTFCEDCEHVYVVNKNDSPRYWLCIKHKRGDGMGYVARGTWTNAVPYLYCRDVNSGFCPLYEKASGSQMRLGEIVGEIE